jgi:hypothetical protein
MEECEMEYKIVVEYDKHESSTSGICDDMFTKSLEEELYNQALKCVENHIKNGVINPDRDMVETFRIYIDGKGMIYNLHMPAGVAAGMRKYPNKKKTTFWIRLSSGVIKSFDDFSNTNWLHVTREEVLDRIADFMKEAREGELSSPLLNIVYVIIDTRDYNNRGMYIYKREWKKIKEKVAAAKPAEKKVAKNELANCRCGGKPYVKVSCESKTVKDASNKPISIKYQNYINIICPDCGAKYEYPIEKFRTLSPFEVLEDADKEKIIMNWNLMNGEFYYF